MQDLAPAAAGRVNERESAAKIQINVLYALVLHDIKSRFFGNAFGYAVTVAWPLAHITAILVMNIGRVTPYGSSMVLYAATAVIPYIASNYIGRFIMLGAITNKSFLQYPIVRPLDLLLSRAFLEVIGNVFVVMIVVAGMSAIDIDVVPADVFQASCAWSAAILLGISCGILGGVICMAFPLFQIIYVVLIIIAWVTCGISIDPELLPQPYAYYISFNPVLHAVEWMRLAYYPSFHAHLLDRTYLVGCGLAMLAGGLILEKAGRSFWLRSR